MSTCDCGCPRADHIPAGHFRTDRSACSCLRRFLSDSLTKPELELAQAAVAELRDELRFRLADDQTLEDPDLAADLAADLVVLARVAESLGEISDDVLLDLEEARALTRVLSFVAAGRAVIVLDQSAAGDLARRLQECWPTISSEKPDPGSGVISETSTAGTD